MFWSPEIYQNDPKKSQFALSQFAWSTSLLKFLSNVKQPSLYWLQYGEKVLWNKEFFFTELGRILKEKDASKYKQQ